MTTHRGRRAWLVFAAASGAYLVAITHRTALGVAGVEALDRFGTKATGLALLSIAQLATYAALQVPAGRLLDRYGPRAVMVSGSLIMAVGQVAMATCHDYWPAVLARMLIGAGDAPIFITASRLVAHWFPPRRAPVMVQATSQIGQLGQLAAAIPVAWVLHAHGWSVTFVALAGVGVVAAVAATTVRPPRPDEHAYLPANAGMAAVTVSRAGVWLGFWTHFTALFSANTIALLWGVPFFITAQGRTAAQASALLTVLTLAKLTVSPLVGRATARHPLRRSWLVLGYAGVTAAAWIALLAPSTPRPMWQLVVFVAVIGVGGPVSLVGLDYARTFADHRALGAANGLVNTGGFAASIVAIALVGLVLELASPGGVYDLNAYRAAFAALALPWGIGVAGIIYTRRGARRDWASDGVVVPPLREAMGQRRVGR